MRDGPAAALETGFRLLSRLILTLGGWIGLVALAAGAPSGPMPYAFLLAMPLVLFAATVIHEAGHAAAGRAPSRGRSLVMVCAGPAANLGAGILLLAGVAHATLPGGVQGIAASVAWISIAMGLANLCPHRRGRHATDGLQLWMLARKRDLSGAATSPKSRA